jgi:hypothetical protein
VTARRILVTGSRSWNDQATIRRVLRVSYRPGTVLVSGACPKGADAMCERAWVQMGGRIERHPADWERHGLQAGHVRNREMVELGAGECLAFIRDRSPGATATAALAERAGILVTRYERFSDPAADTGQLDLFDLPGGAR